MKKAVIVGILIILLVPVVSVLGCSQESAPSPLVPPAAEGETSPPGAGTLAEYNDSGLQLAMEGRYEEAIAEFSKAIELDPEYALTYCSRGIAYNVLNRKSEAIADFEKCIELSQNPSLTQLAKQQLEELQSQQ